MISNTRLNLIVTELFIRGKKLNTSLVFIMQWYFKVTKDVRLNTTHFLIAKIRNKRELQQIVINDSLDIRTEDIINMYRKCTGKPYSFLVIDTTLASDNPYGLEKLFLNIIKFMTINDQIRDENLQYDINREASKISALSCGKIHKYEYLTGEDILLSNQQQIIEQAKFTYSLLGKVFEKQIKTIEDQGQKKADALKQTKEITYKPDDDDNTPISKEIYIKILEERINEILKTSWEINYSKLVHDFKGTIASISFIKFGGPIYSYDELKKGDKTL